MANHGHAHAHSHAGGHPHMPLTREMKGVMLASVAATVLLVAAELIAGILAHSLALVGDGIHNLSDLPTLLISWYALRLAERPPTAEKTYGYHRAGILAAFTNALLLLFVAFGLIYFAVERILHPVEVHEGVMFWMSLAALGVNAGIAVGLLRGRRDLNVRSVLVHNAGDAAASVGILIGSILIAWTRAHWIDSLLGLVIGVVILWSSRGILQESSHILLEGLPREMDLEKVARAILTVESVQEVHDIHIWTLGSDLSALSCHVRIPDMHMDKSEDVLRRIRELLSHDFHITHTTIQFERAVLPVSPGYIMPQPYKSP